MITASTIPDTFARSSKKGGDPRIFGGIVTSKAVFYQKAAEKTGNPMGRKMFLSMIEDEKKHLSALRSIVEGLDIDVNDAASVMERIETFFEKNRGAILEKVKSTTDELEALKIAMYIEEESIKLYEEFSKKAQTPEAKALFDMLVKEEKQHYDTSSNTYFFLADFADWFTWEEHSIMDGGTPWA